MNKIAGTKCGAPDDFDKNVRKPLPPISKPFSLRQVHSITDCFTCLIICTYSPVSLKYLLAYQVNCVIVNLPAQIVAAAPSQQVIPP